MSPPPPSPARTWILIGGIVVVVIVAIWGSWKAATLILPPPLRPSLNGPSAPEDELGLRKLVKDAAWVERGRVAYAQLCWTCHGHQGEGTQGPNLRDDFWLAGNDMTDLMTVIGEGRPNTPMMPMKGLFSRDEMAAIAAYIVSLKGSRAGRDKAAEGPLRPITWH